MGYAAVLDPNVLYPASLRDTLLRFAAAEFYDLLWSERILDEAERNLVTDGRVDESGARRLRNAMTTAFDDAIVPGEAIAALEEAMTNDPKDRHVLAAAVASEAQAVITMNLRDFPAASTEPYGIEAQHPDEFLMVLHAMDPDFAVELVRRQAADLKNPPHSVEDVLDMLALTVPTFAAAIRDGL
jgi:predicted nucleic acid-binding protein